MVSRKYFKGRDRYGTYVYKMGLVFIGKINGKYRVESDLFRGLPRTSVTFYKSEKKPIIKDLLLLNLLLFLPTVLWLMVLSLITLLLILIISTPFAVTIEQINKYDTKLEQFALILSLVFCFTMFLVGVCSIVNYLF